MSSRTDRSSSGYSAGRTSQSLSREELLNQTIGMFARLVCLLLGIGSHISTSLPAQAFSLPTCDTTCYSIHYFSLAFRNAELKQRNMF